MYFSYRFKAVWKSILVISKCLRLYFLTVPKSFYFSLRGKQNQRKLQLKWTCLKPKTHPALRWIGLTLSVFLRKLIETDVTFPAQLLRYMNIYMFSLRSILGLFSLCLLVWVSDWLCMCVCVCNWGRRLVHVGFTHTRATGANK